MSQPALAQENLGPALLGVSWSLAVFSIIIVGLRVFARLRIGRLRPDDWLCILTLSLSIAESIFVTVAVSWGIGRHIQFLSLEQTVYAMKWIFCCEFFGIMTPGFGRISFAILLIELIPPSKWRRRYLWTIIVAQFVIDVGTVIISFSQCQPMARFWDPSIEGNCWPPKVQEYAGYFQGSVGSLVDLALAVFPVSLFWKLKLKVSTKISLSVLMGLGTFAMIASIAKTIELKNLVDKGDETWAMAIFATCWTLETYLVLIATTIPTLRLLVTKRKTPQTRISNNNNRRFYQENLYEHPAPQLTSSRGSFYPLTDTTAKGGKKNDTTIVFSETAYHDHVTEDVDNSLELGKIQSNTAG